MTRDPDPPRVADRSLSERIVALSGGERFAWPEVAAVLEGVEATAYWKEVGDRSFSAWIEHVASTWRMSPAVLWRTRSVAKSLPDLLAKLEELGLPRVTEEQLPDLESLELLAKISQELRGPELAELARRVMTHQTGRSELRRTWTHLKAARDNETLRLRDQPVGTARDDAIAVTARLLGALRGGQVPWLDGGKLIRVVHGTSLPGSVGYAIGPELTVVTTSRLVPSAGIHYLHYSATRTRKEIALFRRLAPFYDSLWLVAQDHDIGAVSNLPRSFGQLSLGTNGLVVVARAEDETKTGGLAGETARILLAMGP